MANGKSAKTPRPFRRRCPFSPRLQKSPSRMIGIVAEVAFGAPQGAMRRPEWPACRAPRGFGAEKAGPKAACIWLDTIAAGHRNDKPPHRRPIVRAGDAWKTCLCREGKHARAPKDRHSRPHPFGGNHEPDAQGGAERSGRGWSASTTTSPCSRSREAAIGRFRAAAGTCRGD